METIFTKIVKGEIPAYKIAENEKFLAFLDINPLTEGHTLVIPKTATDYLFDLAENDFLELQQFAYKVAKSLKPAMHCERVGVCVIGFEVPHCHIHLIPINKMEDMNFANPKLKLKPEEFTAVAEKIRAFI